MTGGHARPRIDGVEKRRRVVRFKHVNDVESSSEKDYFIRSTVVSLVRSGETTLPG